MPIVAILLGLGIILQPPTADVQTAMPLFAKVFDALAFSWVARTIVAVLLAMGTAFLLNTIVSNNEVTGNNFMAALVYIVLTASSKEFLKLNPIHFANVLLLIALWRMFGLYKTEGRLGPSFDSALFISVASFFYFPAVSIFLVLLVAIPMLRAPSWRDYAVALVGFIVPYLFLSVYYFWNDKLPYFWDHYIAEPFINRTLNLNPTPADVSLMVILALLLLVSLFDNFTNPTNTRSIKRRRFLNVVFIYLIVAIAAITLTPDWSATHFVMLAVPLTVFVSNFLQSFKYNYFPEAIFWVLIATALFNQYTNA